MDDPQEKEPKMRFLQLLNTDMELLLEEPDEHRCADIFEDFEFCSFLQVAYNLAGGWSDWPVADVIYELERAFEFVEEDKTALVVQLAMQMVVSADCRPGSNGVMHGNCVYAARDRYVRKMMFLLRLDQSADIFAWLSAEEAEPASILADAGLDLDRLASVGIHEWDLGLYLRQNEKSNLRFLLKRREGGNR